MSSAGGIVSAAFNPPPEDRKIVYAKELTVREEIQDEVIVALVCEQSCVLWILVN